MPRKNRKARITKIEKDAMMALDPRAGDILCMIRNHPHTSTDHPFLHIDIIFFKFINEDHFIFIGKEHLPVSPRN